MPRVDMKALQAQTAAAAQKAQDLGMISPECFAAMTDGSLSNFDLALAQAGRNADRYEFRPAMRAAIRHGWLRPPRSSRNS